MKSLLILDDKGIGKSEKFTSYLDDKCTTLFFQWIVKA